MSVEVEIDLSGGNIQPTLLETFPPGDRKASDTPLLELDNGPPSKAWSEKEAEAREEEEEMQRSQAKEREGKGQSEEQTVEPIEPLPVGVKEEKEEAKPSKLVAVRFLFKLFRYATCFDVILMLLGMLGAMLHGASLPLLFLAFGDLTSAFINQAISQGLTALTNTTSIQNCSETFPDFVNFTLRELTTIANASIIIPCDLVIAPSTTLTSLVEECVSTEAMCVTNSQFITEINNNIYIFVAIAVGVFIVAYFEISLFQTACERQVQKIRLSYYRAILRQEIGWFDANASGALASRLSDDIDKIHDGIGDKVGLFIQWLSVFVTGFLVGFIREWRLTLLLVGFTPFLAVAGAIMSGLIASFASKEQKQYADAGAVAEEVLSSVRTVVAFGGEDKEAERYRQKLKLARLSGAKKGFSVGISLAFVFFLIFLVDSAAFWFGGFLISENITQGGNVLTVFFSTLIGAFALGQAAPNLEALLTAAGSAQVIYTTIDRVPEIDSSSDEGVVPDKFDSSVQLNKVFFSYPTRPNVPVLEGLTLDVKVGQTVALVGPSGCGKSTVIQLLQRFYNAERGEVMVGGHEVSSLNLKWLRRHIGVVSQEPVLFDTTIAENILYGRGDASMEDIEKAAKNANAHDFIKDLPDGYNTLVGERGTQLSGGQKQRIAIARALVRDPKLLFLDEATSALDTESESIVQQALDKAREGRTTIVIAHRLSTIQSADVIASIEDGQVVEMGTHSELMDKHGLYYELVTAQSFSSDESYAVEAPTFSRLLSGKRRSTRRQRSRGSESEDPHSLQHQDSLHAQVSITADPTSPKRMLSKEALKKKQLEWDSDLKEVSLLRVIKYNAPEWWLIILGVIGAGCNGSIFPIFSIFFGEILAVFSLPADQILGDISLWGGLFIVLAVISAVSVFTKVVCFTISGENLTARLRLVSFKSMLRQEIGWFDQERNATGALTTRLADDAGQVQGATGSRLGTLVETMIGLLLAVAISFAYNWVLTFVILGVVPFLMIAGALEVKALQGHSTKNKKALETSGKVAVDSFSNIRTVASLGIEPAFFEQYSHHTQRPYRNSLVNTVVYGLTYAVSQSTVFLMYAIVFRFGAFQVTLPEDHVVYQPFQNIFVAFIALVFGAVGAGQAGAFAPNYAKAKLSANRIFSLLDREPVIDSYSEEGAKPETVSGEVTSTDVCFSYPSRPDVRVLQGLDISVKPGQTLALVGPSGCGKSTVVSLLERFYDPSGGQLTLDGTDTSELNIRWLRSKIGIVSQEPVLFDASIADNVRYGANFRTVSDEEVIEATKAANIHSFIESLPQGYGTNVGAKGTQLSGGQKQRIAIARALVRDPKVLLLDEATSALDTESEKVVQEALDKAREGRTSIVIAHRLSTIYNADCIVVISGGRAIEKGTHSELMAQKGIYYKLNRFQVIDADGPPSKAQSEEPIELQ